jgi:hypothetical protein
MKAQQTKTSKAVHGRFIVRKPSTLKDYARIYRFKNDVLKKAKELEKTLCTAY